ncbi:MAG: helix-turn-helix domain-containing protein [Inquilinus sp.]|uniref:helix-turn-helix domain-containing protein n=1 Tax=Inquilinus sp. TaxID=1932117 RepID=UPI003F3FF139
MSEVTSAEIASSEKAEWCTVGAFSTNDRWKWFQGLSADAELTATDRFIGLQLWERLGRESGYLSVKHDTLAKQIGVSNKTVRRAIQSLVSRGWIERATTRGEHGYQSANAYRLAFPATASMPQQVVASDHRSASDRWSSVTIGEAGPVVIGDHAQATIAAGPAIGMVNDRLGEEPSGAERRMPSTSDQGAPASVGTKPSASPAILDLIAEARAAVPPSGLIWPP